MAASGVKRQSEVSLEDLATEGDIASNDLIKVKKKKKTPKPLSLSKFGGMTEEEVCKLLLPDHMKAGLDIIFIGINPGLYSAYMGHHYCNPSNHFWPCLYESGLIPKKLTFKEDAQLLNYGIGITNIVPRTTRAANELSRKEMKEWSEVMIERMKKLKPMIACFNGKGIYEIFNGGKCTVGLQSHPLPDTETLVYVMPSTSGLAATYPRRADKLKFFKELKELKDKMLSERGHDAVEKGDVAMEKGDVAMEKGDVAVEKGDVAMEKGHDAVEKGDGAVEFTRNQTSSGSYSNAPTNSSACNS